MRLYSVGHSSQPVASLVALLRDHGVATLSDVRALPRSRRWPQFDRDALAATLLAADITYRWLGRELGGYRRAADPESPHVALEGAWRNYADHMATDAFRAGIASLLATGGAFLCAERDWRSCHRRHIADHLVAIEGAEVIHLPGGEAHRLDARARVVGGALRYDRGQRELF